MTVFLLGEDSLGVECVKITRGNYDPKTTPDAQRNRFYFNSKWKDQVVTPDIELMPLVRYAGDRTVFIPAGTNMSTCEAWRVDTRNAKGGGGYNYDSAYSFKGKARYPQLRYDLPVMELLEIRTSTGRYQQRRMTAHEFGAGYGDAGVVGGYWGYGSAGSWHRRREAATLTDLVNLDYTPGEVMAGSDSDTHWSMLVYNLPGNNVALDGPAPPSYSARKLGVQVNDDYCRVAKPGFDVRTARPEQLAFDSSGRPLAVIAADDIAIPKGASSYNVGMALPDHCVVDMSCYDDTSAIFYPMKLTQDEDPYGVEYWFDGNLIRFSNTRKACRARFIVFGADPRGPSSGSNRVLRHFTSGGENVVQLLRPGSANPPRFADIILDTRRPVIQVLADGYFSVPNAPSFGVTATTVNFDASGFFPYVKYMTVHGSGLSMEVRAPRVNCRFQNSLSRGGLAGDGSYCRYNTKSATFYTARGTPNYIYYSAAGGGSVKTVYDDKPMVGLRWFVFGIPIA